MSSELKHCPFCKEQERLYVLRSIGNAYWGKCLECGAEGPIAKTEQEAIDAWNTRAERTSEIIDIKEFEYEWDAWCEGKCSCGEWFDITRRGRPNYCPNCGAKVVD